MARGWESKEVESQIEAAESRKAEARHVAPTPEQAARERQRDTLEMSRVRVLHDLETASYPRHREMLRQALRHLEQQIAELDAH